MSYQRRIHLYRTHISHKRFGNWISDLPWLKLQVNKRFNDGGEEKDKELKLSVAYKFNE